MIMDVETNFRTQTHEARRRRRRPIDDDFKKLTHKEQVRVRQAAIDQFFPESTMQLVKGGHALFTNQSHKVLVLVGQPKGHRNRIWFGPSSRSLAMFPDSLILCAVIGAETFSYCLPLTVRDGIPSICSREITTKPSGRDRHYNLYLYKSEEADEIRLDLGHHIRLAINQFIHPPKPVLVRQHWRDLPTPAQPESDLTALATPLTLDILKILHPWIDEYSARDPNVEMVLSLRAKT